MKTHENPNKKNEESQTSKILRHLQSGQSINYIQALELYGCLRLSAVIYRLRKSGYKIHINKVTAHKNEYFINDELDYIRYFNHFTGKKTKKSFSKNTSNYKLYCYLLENDASAMDIYQIFKRNPNALVSHIKHYMKDNEKLVTEWCKNPETNIKYKVYRIVKKEKS